MYATPSDLASFLKEDVDASTATLALQTASQLFSTRADTMFNSTSVTYQTQGLGYRQLMLPFRPIISVDEVRIVNQFALCPCRELRGVRRGPGRRHVSVAAGGRPCSGRWRGRTVA